jgi:hypothetical protein
MSNFNTFTYVTIVLITLLMLFSQPAYTQLHIKPLDKTALKSEFKKYVKQVLKQQSLAYARPDKTREIKERLIAIGVEDYQTNDSVFFKYSGNNTSVFDFNDMIYDYFLDINQVTRFANPYDWGTVNIMSDSFFVYGYNPDKDSLTLKKIDENVINSNGKIDKWAVHTYTDETQSGYDPLFLYYNETNKLSHMLALSDKSGTLDTIDKLDRYYNIQGLKTVDSVFTYSDGIWTPSQILRYDYDNNKNVTSLKVFNNDNDTWIPFIKMDHTFYPNNQFKTIILYISNNGTLEPYYKDTLEYTHGVPFVTKEHYYDYAGENNWFLSYQEEKILNAQNLPHTSISTYYYFDNPVIADTLKRFFTYDNFGNPTKEVDMLYDTTSSSFLKLQTYNYHYELFNTSSITQVIKDINILVYPNPANDHIFLEYNGTDNKPITLQITNIFGQLMDQQSVYFPQIKNQFSINKLVSGLYLISIYDNKGRLITTKKLLKQ